MAYSLVNHVEAALGVNGGTTGAIDTTGASFLVLAVGWYVGGTAPSVSDSKSNTWVPLTQQSFGGVSSSRLYYSIAPTVGSGHTFTASGSSSYSSICVLAFSGSHASPYDQENGSGATSSTIQAGSLTPSEDNCLVVAGVCPSDGSGNISINGGFTEYDIIWVIGNNEGCGIGYLIQTTAAAANPTWTMDASSAVTATIATFKAAAGGGGGGVHPYWIGMQPNMTI